MDDEKLLSEQEALERELRGPMSAYLVKTPTAEETRDLIGKLQGEFDLLKNPAASMEVPDPATAPPASHMERARAASQPQGGGIAAYGGDSEPAGRSLLAASAVRRRQAAPSLLRLYRMQLRTFSRSFWLSLAALVLMLVLAGERIGGSGWESGLLPLILPAALLGGIGYSSLSNRSGMRAVEAVAPYPPGLLHTSRIVLLSAAFIVAGMMASLFLEDGYSRQETALHLLRWLSPLVLIGGLSSYLHFRRGMRFALTSAAAGWLIQLVLGEWVANRTLAVQTGLLLEAGWLAAGAVLIILAYRRLLRLREGASL
ncbi:hypothetical protein J31TS4_02240 [Paenibacillus sp. J31TS4]|nr:hypothetical protein J31TS4_02240 [Paenibacillus sp. J31TS4]